MRDCTNTSDCTISQESQTPKAHVWFEAKDPSLYYTLFLSISVSGFLVQNENGFLLQGALFRDSRALN